MQSFTIVIKSRGSFIIDVVQKPFILRRLISVIKRERLIYAESI